MLYFSIWSLVFDEYHYQVYWLGVQLTADSRRVKTDKWLKIRHVADKRSII